MYNGIVEKCRGPSGQPDGFSFYGGIAMSILVTNIFGSFKLAVEELEKETE